MSLPAAQQLKVLVTLHEVTQLFPVFPGRHQRRDPSAAGARLLWTWPARLSCSAPWRNNPPAADAALSHRAADELAVGHVSLVSTEEPRTTSAADDGALFYIQSQIRLPGWIVGT